MIVRVYWNEQRGQWAVVKVGNGNRKVTFYAEELTLTNATFHVGNGGKVCKSGHKNRHNFVEGKLSSFQAYPRAHRGGYPADHAVQYGEGVAAPWTKYNEVVPLFRAERVEFTDYGRQYVPCSERVCGGAE